MLNKKYRLTIDRTVRFQLDVLASSRFDALQKITATALEEDTKDHKDTYVVSIKELPDHPAE